jgi:hypothetical protein
MADRVRRIRYCYVTVPNRAGQGARVLGQLKEAGVNLLAFSAFPTKGGEAQVDLVAASLAPVRRVARRQGWRVSRDKKGFLVAGTDRVGAVHHHIGKLAAEGISVTAADAVTTGNRYGLILWVKPRDYARAARALGAR